MIPKTVGEIVDILSFGKSFHFVKNIAPLSVVDFPQTMFEQEIRGQMLHYGESISIKLIELPIFVCVVFNELLN